MGGRLSHHKNTPPAAPLLVFSYQRSAQPTAAAMPKAMRPVVKIEDGAGSGYAEEGRQRRRVNEAGDAVSAEAGLMLRSNAELQAQAIEGMERTRVLGEELQRAKVRIAELAAEVKMRDEALQAKEALLLTITKTKDDMLQAKDSLLLCKDALFHTKDAEMQTITMTNLINVCAHVPAQNVRGMN
jgi:hypothetical protein